MALKQTTFVLSIALAVVFFFIAIIMTTLYMGAPSIEVNSLFQLLFALSHSKSRMRPIIAKLAEPQCQIPHNSESSRTNGWDLVIGLLQ